VITLAQRGLKPEVSADIRLRLLSRRAKAYASIGSLQSALVDLREALKIEPEN